MNHDFIAVHTTGQLSKVLLITHDQRFLEGAPSLATEGLKLAVASAVGKAGDDDGGAAAWTGVSKRKAVVSADSVQTSDTGWILRAERKTSLRLSSREDVYKRVAACRAHSSVQAPDGHMILTGKAAVNCKPHAGESASRHYS
jgi:hypothetical protein